MMYSAIVAMQFYTQEANPNLIFSQSFNLKQNPSFQQR